MSQRRSTPAGGGGGEGSQPAGAPVILAETLEDLLRVTQGVVDAGMALVLASSSAPSTPPSSPPRSWLSSPSSLIRGLSRGLLGKNKNCSTSSSPTRRSSARSSRGERGLSDLGSTSRSALVASPRTGSPQEPRTEQPARIGGVQEVRREQHEAPQSRSDFGEKMRNALARAKDQVDADGSEVQAPFDEMKQAMTGLMERTYGKAELSNLPELPHVFATQLPYDDADPLDNKVMKNPIILASGYSLDGWSHLWSVSRDICPVTKKPLSHSFTFPNDLLRDMISAWCLDHSLCSSTSTIEALPMEPSEVQIEGILQKFSEHSALQEDALHDIQNLSKITKGEQPCLEKWPELIPVLIDLQKNFKSTWIKKLEELRLTIILNLSVHRPNMEILAGATHLPDALENISGKLARLGECPVSPLAEVASTVANLSEFEDSRKRILDIGGMEMLQDLLKIKDVVVRKEAVAAISVLCKDQEDKARAESCNVADLLVECLTITDEALVLLDCLQKDPHAVDKLSNRGHKAVELVNVIMADQESEAITPKALHSAISLRNSRDKRSCALEPEESSKGCWRWAIASLRVAWFVVSYVWRTVFFWLVEYFFCDDPLPEAPLPGYSWLSMMGSPIANTDSSCAISACTMCIVALHRLAFERVHGKGSFPCDAKLPEELKCVCTRRGVWDSESGAFVKDVLRVIVDVGGVLTTPEPKSIQLPIDGYIFIRRGMDPQLGRKRFARILYACGPLIGSLWASDEDYDNCLGDMVYRGCPREQRVPGSGSYHAVVCFQYKFTSDEKELHVRIMDNYNAAGPMRWILFEAFRYFYLPIVEKPVEPQQLFRKKMTIKEHILYMFEKLKLWLINHEARRYCYVKRQGISRLNVHYWVLGIACGSVVLT